MPKRGLEGMLILPLIAAAIPLGIGLKKVVSYSQDPQEALKYFSVSLIASGLVFAGSLMLRNNFHRVRDYFEDRYHLKLH